MSSADFSKSTFRKLLSRIPTEYQTVLNQIRPDKPSGQIWVQTVCKVDDTSRQRINRTDTISSQVRIQRGDRGSGPPPGKSQVIWISIGNKQLDPPPPPGKCWTPSGTLKNDRFLWNWPFDFFKISWGPKKTLSELFLSDWPGPPWRKFLDPRMPVILPRCLIILPVAYVKGVVPLVH